MNDCEIENCKCCKAKAHAWECYQGKLVDLTKALQRVTHLEKEIEHNVLRIMSHIDRVCRTEEALNYLIGEVRKSCGDDDVWDTQFAEVTRILMDRSD